MNDEKRLSKREVENPNPTMPLKIRQISDLQKTVGFGHIPTAMSA